MAEKRDLSLEELEAVGGGWSSAKLSPEDAQKCRQLWQENFDAQGTDYWEEATRKWTEFDAYLCRKYGKG